MTTRITRHLLALILLASVTGAANAATTHATWHFVTDTGQNSPFVGRTAGADLLWGTADDTAASGRNAQGYASTFTGGYPGGPLELLGFFGGTFTTTTQDDFATFSVTGVDAVNTTSCLDCVPPFFDAPGSAVLSQTSGGTNGGQGTAPGVYEWALDTANGPTGVLRSSGLGYVLVPGIAPADLFADADIVAHFETLLPLLPSDWVIASVSLLDIVGIEGSLSGFGGRQSMSFYATPADLTVVPLPAAAWMVAAPLVLLRRRIALAGACATRQHRAGIASRFARRPAT